MKSFPLPTEHPRLTAYLGRWHRCEAVKLTQAHDGRYVLHVADDLGEEVRRECELRLGEAA